MTTTDPYTEAKNTNNSDGTRLCAIAMHISDSSHVDVTLPEVEKIVEALELEDHMIILVQTVLESLFADGQPRHARAVQSYIHVRGRLMEQGINMFKDYSGGKRGQR